MIKSFLLTALIFLAVKSIQAQSDSIHLSKQVDFLLYLVENRQLDDFNYYGDQLLNDSLHYSEGLRDSVSFILGDANNRFHDSKKARLYFDRVGEFSPFIYKARFTSAVLDVEDNKLDHALGKIATFNLMQDELIHELTIFESAGINLMKRDFTSYDSLTNAFNPATGIIATEYQLLSASNELMRTTKRKSAFVAGCLSAVIPGLGKLYDGKKGQALAAFLKVVPLGIIAFENYQRHGSRDAQFIIYSSLFSIFYIGNIWGSAIGVQINYHEKINAINHNIAVGLRIPVDKLFQ